MTKKQEEADSKQVTLKYLLLKAAYAALSASKVVLEVYHSKDFQVELKEDESPVTIADRKSHNVLVEILGNCNLRYPVLSEEGEKASAQSRASWQTLWVVDPLDGTKEFIERSGEFGINIALVERRIPVLGVIQVPLSDVLYIGAKGIGAYKIQGASSIKIELDEEGLAADKIEKAWEYLRSKAKPLPAVNRRSPLRLKVVVSRSHMNVATEKFLERLRRKVGNFELTSAGSATKLCFLAEGEAELYPRFAPTKEWDTAAGDAILRETGGAVFRAEDLKPLVYNKADLRNPYFIACSSYFKENLKMLFASL